MSSSPKQRFSQLYINRDERLPDSPRARRRLSSLVRTVGHWQQLGFHVEHELGVRIGTDHGYYWSEWEHFINNAPLRDFLDIVTEVFVYLRGQTGLRDLSNKWLAEARRIFIEEHVAYSIDDNGVVHPAIDAEFQRNRSATIAGLTSPRYANVLSAFERISDELSETPPHGKEAWRAVFAAAEGLFRLMFPASPRLTANEIETRLAPVVRNRYADDATALRAAERLLASFKDWVDASHNYRHEPGSEEPIEPPLEVAILAISNGAAFIRWLLELDAGR
jgi:hypothetical protein